MKEGVIKQVGRYMVGQAIGEGSFGKVYKGVDKVDNTEVALKFISKRGKNKKELEGLKQQNQMLKTISHKNIIKLLGFHEAPNEIIIITEFAGENLSDVLERKKQFTYDEVRHYCKQIFDALCYLDQNRIAHRDLKPQNILVKDQVVKLCDFGFARKLSASTNFMNSLKGTPLYIAPEILGIGPLNYTKKVDVWSFGIIIYELFAGRPPFYADNLPKLKPKILHSKVVYPSSMPVQLKTVIDRMLQKSPDNRADWQQLKKYPIFSNQVSALTEKPMNVQKVSVQKEEVKPEVPLVKEESEKEIDRKGKLNRLASLQDLEEMKKIESDLQMGKIEGKKLRLDSTLYEKIMSIYSSYFAGEGLVTKQSLIPITSILHYLLSKIKSTEVDPALDITRRKELLFCAIKLAEQDSDPETLSTELVLIGFLIKNNFDNVSIDFEIDQDVLEICVREVQAARSTACFGNALTVLGTLASQGIITIGNSEEFFIRVEKEEILVAIAGAYEPLPSKRIVLQCLQKFIHPNQFPSTIQKSQPQLRKAFTSMKQQVARTLLTKNFLIYNPLTIYKDPQYVECYAKILYECINVSDPFRKEFLKNSYWIDFLQFRNLRVFCFAYDFVCIQRDKVCLIPNDVIKGAVNNQNMKKVLMENALYLARAEFYLSNKQVASQNKQDSTLKIINEIRDILLSDEEVKKKASREVEGFLSTGSRILEEVLGQTFCNFMNDPFFDKSVVSGDLIQTILENLLNLKPEDQLKVTTLTAARLLISIDQLLRSQTTCPQIRQNPQILTTLGRTISHFLQNSLIFQIQNQHGPQLVKRLLSSIFNIIKLYALVDQKQQSQFFYRLEANGIPNLLVSNHILDKNSLGICLTILQRLSAQNKYIGTIVDFVGLNLIDKLKPYLSLDLEEKDTEIVVQILLLLSLVIKKSEEHASKIKQLDIIPHFPRYLQHPTNENIRHQTLNLIGNMAKHSMYFFEDFSTCGIFPTLADTIKRYGVGNKNRILKGLVYAIGNVSFYTDRFHKQFTTLIPQLHTALTLDDPHIVSNTISTISNLLRHSPCYLKALVKHKIVQRVLQIVMDSTKADNPMMFGLNMIKKLLAYPEIFQDVGKGEFVAIYVQKVKLVGEDNQCMRKIRTFM